MSLPTDHEVAGFRNSFPLIPITCLLVSVGCLHDPQAPESTGPDLAGFIELWENYEELYPLFVYKGVDWVQVMQEYYLQAAECSTDEELLEVTVAMMEELQDPYIYLCSSETQDTIMTCQPEYDPNVDMDVLLNNYLIPNGFQGYQEGMGWCDPAVLPYAYFDTLLSENDTLGVAALDSFVSACNALELPSLILDVRMNPSGMRAEYHSFDHTVPSRFTSKARVCAWYRTRAGAEYDQYHDWHPWITPDGPAQFTGTVYLLAGGGCDQAAEDLAANLERFPNVVIVGDTTSGQVSEVSFSNYLGIEGNWKISGVESTILTYDKSWVEGNGVPPDVYVEATPGDFAAGVDPVLEYAIQQLRTD